MSATSPLDEQDFDECFAGQPPMPSPLEDLARARRDRRRARTRVLLAMAVALVVGVGGVGWGLRSVDGDIDPVAPPTELDANANLIEGVRSDPDHQGLVVSYTGGRCDASAQLATQESDTIVAVRLVVERKSGSCTSEGIPRTVTTRLGQPVGQRDVWVSGRKYVPFDGARLLVPKDLPAGFGPAVEAGISTGATEAETSPAVTTVWTSDYDSWVEPAGDTCVPSRGAISIRLGPATADRYRSSTKVGVANVGSVVATVYRSGSAKDVDGWTYVWTPDDIEVALSSSRNCATDRVLGRSELLQIAESLRPA